MILYFSGTGNSRYAAQIFAAKLNDKLLDAGAIIRENRRTEIHSERPWIFVSPTYAWQLPRVFTEFIRTGSFSGAKAAYFVMTCGSDIGNAGAKIAQLCREKCFDYKGVLQVVMPKNYVAMYPVPNAEESRRIIAAAQPVIEAGIKAVSQGQQLSGEKISLADRVKTSYVNPIFYKFFVKAKPFYATDVCIACGKCERACPLNNITLAQGKPQWSNRCTHCMACICGCPKEAIEYGKVTPGKPRYWCEAYKA